MTIFYLQNGKLLITQHCLLIPEFKALWESHKDKNVAVEEFAYIYYLCDYKSPYQSYSEDVRLSKIQKDYISRKGWKPTPLVQACIHKYQEMQQTPTMRYLQDAKYACSQISSYFRSVNFSERDDRGHPVFKVTEVTKALADSEKIIKTLDSLAEKVEREIATRNVVGGGESGLFED